MIAGTHHEALQGVPEGRQPLCVLRTAVALELW